MWYSNSHHDFGDPFQPTGSIRKKTSGVTRSSKFQAEPLVNGSIYCLETLTHNKIIPEDEQGANIWDILTQRPATRQTHQSATFWDVGEQAEEDLQDDEQDYGYDEDEAEETIRSPRHRRPRPNILDDDVEEDDDQEPFNMPESSAEHSLFITQPNPEPYHEPGTLSQTQKGKTPLAWKRWGCLSS